MQPRLASAVSKASRARYCVLLLSFVVGMVMYMDRACIGTAAPWIRREFGIDKIAIGWSLSAFNWTYGLFQVPGGWLADRFGSRIVLAVAIAWWSVFTAATGAAVGPWSLASTRALFGMGEAAAWPAASRALVRWLPSGQRAFGQGFQHSGSRLGGAFAPALVVFLVAHTGWRGVFYLFGAVGVCVAVAWHLYYRDLPREHRGVNQAELDLLDNAQLRRDACPAVPWGRVLRSPDLLLVSLMYFCYGWVFWMYMTWFPSYLSEARHFSSMMMGLGASLPPLVGAVTNVAGGWLSDRLARTWRDLRRGRTRVASAGFAIAGAAILAGSLATHAGLSLAFMTLGFAGLELTVAVSWAMALDLAGDFSGSVSGVMNMFGSIGGGISSVLIGYLSTALGWTLPIIACAGFCVMAAVLASRVDPTRSAVAESKSTSLTL